MRDFIIMAICTVCVVVSVVWAFDLRDDVPEFTSEHNYLSTELVPKIDEEDIEFDGTTVTIDNEFTQMVLNVFVEDAVAHGLDYEDVVTHIKALDVIVVRDMSGIIIDGDPTETELLGLTLAREGKRGRIRGAIIINEDLLDDLDLYAFTLYHELGHWFGLEHCGCDDRIMMDTHTDHDVKLAFAKWDQSVRLFMGKIQDKYNEKKHHYDFPDVN
jgi:PAS domain-containing protein